MVCRRCIIIVTQIFQKHGTEPLDVQLGKVTLSKPISKKELEPIQQELENCGFEVIETNVPASSNRYAQPLSNMYITMMLRKRKTYQTISAANANGSIACSANYSQKQTALPLKNTTSPRKSNA